MHWRTSSPEKQLQPSEKIVLRSFVYRHTCRPVVPVSTLQPPPLISPQWRATCVSCLPAPVGLSTRLHNWLHSCLPPTRPPPPPTTRGRHQPLNPPWLHILSTFSTNSTFCNFSTNYCPTQLEVLVAASPPPSQQPSLIIHLLRCLHILH